MIQGALLHLPTDFIMLICRWLSTMYQLVFSQYNAKERKNYRLLFGICDLKSVFCEDAVRIWFK